MDDYVAGVINEQLRKRVDSVSKNLLITCSLACGIPQVRLAIVDKLEQLIQAKAGKQAQELLFYLAANIAQEQVSNLDHQKVNFVFQKFEKTVIKKRKFLTTENLRM